jgi:WD40 repeat protein
MSLDEMEDDVVTVPVTLKWSKQTFSLEFRLGESPRNFKQTVEKLTGVPVERQKLLAKHGWKGTLRDDFVFEKVNNKNKTTLVVTLIGSAETLREPPLFAAAAAQTGFLEDLSPEQRLAAEQAQQQAAMATAEGMIAVLQRPPDLRDDGKKEVYSYNRLVTGLPQRQIEELLRKRRQRDNSKDDTTATTTTTTTTTTTALGSVVMTLGLELRRAYVNDLAVLQQDGTLVSALDDGHVQLWRHGELFKEVIHNGGGGGVESVVAFPKNSTNNNNNVAFVTGGRGCIRLWTTDAEPILALPTPSGTSPTSLVTFPVLDDTTTCLVAARLRITRRSNPNQFRLMPQDEEGRRRRAQAQAEEAVIQETLERMARSIQVWFSLSNNKPLRSTLLEPQDSPGAAAISSLVALNETNSGVLVSGDVQGVVRLWKPQRTDEDIHFQQSRIFQLLPPQEDEACSIQCMEALRDGRLVISTDRTKVSENLFVSSATDIRVPLPRAVYVMDVTTGTISVVLDGHKDVVQCLCELPNGDLLTGGGRFDATLQLWKSSQCKENDGVVRVVHSKPAKMLEDVGYVFSLAVLPDQTPGSTYFAVAAARYNVVKIVL